MMRIIPGLRSSPSQEVLKVVQVEMEMKNITVKKKNTERNRLIKDIKLNHWKNQTKLKIKMRAMLFERKIIKELR